MNALDPRLIGPHVKDEPLATPPLRTTSVPTMMPPMHRFANGASNGSPYLPARGAPFSYAYPSLTGTAGSRRDSLFDTADSTESPGSYTYPEPPRQSRYMDLPTAVGTSPTPGSPSTPTRTSTPERRDADNSKLKGVLWPGMSIFDSATPTARRRRNQKKDASILEQLEASSLEVQPTEAIWLPDGELKKERIITGDVDSSSSPWKSTPPRPEDDRQPLAEVPIRKPYFGHGQLDRHSYNTYTDELAEQRLSYPDRGQRKRRFQVYKDHNSDLDEEEDEHPASLTRPAPMTYLTRGLSKENEQQPSLKEDQNMFASRFSSNPFGRNSGDDDHQYRSSAQMDDYNQPSYTSNVNLFRLADAAATSTPFPTNAGMSNGYHNTASTPYSLGYASHFLHQTQVGSLQQQYQYQAQHQHPTIHVSSHLRALSATAGPVHARSLSSNLHPLGMSQHNPFGAYGYGNGNSYQTMDQPSMFTSNNEIWDFGANGGIYNHGSRSGSAFDHPTPAPMMGSLEASPAQFHQAGENSASPVVRKVDGEIILTHGVGDHELCIDDALSERPSCGQPEGSEDENKTVTAPSTPYA
jgi:hypothetical protein